jgi:hypothetical protein
MTLPLLAQETEKDVPWKATDEIARRGDLVEHVDGFQDAEDPAAAVADALSVPEDDSYKWHVTLVSTKGCAACEKLKADFASSPALQAWVNVGDYKKSWAHFQAIDISDPTQAWRWKEFKPSTFPTLIVQPPYNGTWGDPHTVVFLQAGYGGNAEELARSIRGAIEKYAARVYPRHLVSEMQRGSAPAGLSSEGGQEQFSPPFAPPSPSPIPLPFLPMQPFPTIPPAPAPAPAPAAPSGQGLMYLLTLLTGSNLVVTLLAMFLPTLKARAATTPGKLDDALIDIVAQIVERRLTPPAGPAR